MLRTNKHLLEICELRSIFVSLRFTAHGTPTNVIDCFFSTTNSSTPGNFLVEYLINNFKFSKDKASLIMKRFPHIKSLDKAHSTVRLFRQLCFSDDHIVSSVRFLPQILFLDAQKVLKPKLMFFKEMGISGCDLGHFISKNPILLTVSLHNRLIPCTNIVKEVLSTRATNENLIKVITRCSRVISKDPKLVLLQNISFLQSCGIVGSQLSMFLLRQPGTFIRKEAALKEIEARVLDMGFSKDSRMFVYGFYSLSCVTHATMKRKFDILQDSGFSEVEILEMFRRAPTILRTSEVKLKAGINLFMNMCKFKKEILVRSPTILVNSIECRAIPRYRVLETLKVKGLLRKQPAFSNVMHLRDDVFLEKYISKFKDNSVELMEIYIGES